VKPGLIDSIFSLVSLKATHPLKDSGTGVISANVWKWIPSPLFWKADSGQSALKLRCLGFVIATVTLYTA
jgi:hypothetical protein